MADVAYLTPDQADALIAAGASGKVVNPAKGEWPYTHKVAGYSLDPENDQRVKSLKLVTVETTASETEYDPRDSSKPLAERRIVRQVDPHPVEVTPACNPRWFAPARALIDGTATAATPAANPSAKPATPAAAK